MSTRTARVTLRCLTDDLALSLPPLEVEIGTVDHPLISEAWRVAPVAEEAQERILAISSPLIYKIRHSRWRGATWLEREAEILWLAAAALREEGSHTDPYVHFVGLHEVGQLLPADDDRLRQRAEAAALLIPDLRAALREGLQAARARPGEDHRFVSARLSLRLYVLREEGWEQIWLAVRTVDVEGNGVKEETRNVVFGLLEEIVGEAEWEPQARWPSGALHGCEVVRWGLLATDGD